ncbi:MAG TPA: PilZ domain-containing protein, partial [Gemmatimonadaceae bacterium]|nr:PilZ domain-containing protein [Gemmatimonadaceae bacterium]
RAEALDVSEGGMFVHPSHALSIDSSLNFSAVLDDGDTPISGRAKVVRHISEADARVRGLNPGYGLAINELSTSDAARWAAFLNRIERRTAKRVLIGASAQRLEELQALLAAAGYAVTGGTDVGAIVQLASSENRPVDAAVIDAGWLTPGASATWIESLFSARSVPLLTLHGDARRARAAVDKLLAVQLGD